MKRRVILTLGGISLLPACVPRDEFPHQTVEAYEADGEMRERVLQTCADHIRRKSPFKTTSDTDECRKAVAADQDVRLAERNTREAAASRAALASAAKQFGGD